MNEYSNISISPLFSSTQEGQYLLFYNEQYYEANLQVVELVEELQEQPTEEEAISSYISRKEGKYTPEQVRQIINKCITPLFSPRKKNATFLYEKELFSETAIDKFSEAFRFFFNKIYMTVILSITVSLNAYFFFFTENLFVFNTNTSIYLIAGIFIFMLTSSFFHEIGHASACKYFGLRHGGVGFGLYLNFPVLYTDVSEVWKLKRKQRCVVNIAGVYFQLYLLLILLTAFLLTGNDILRYLILIMNLGFLMTMNPFFKFDGYWIASDLLGVPNLRTRSVELLRYWYCRLRKLPVSKKPFLLQIHPVEKYGLLVYSIVVNLFMGFYFLYVIPRFLYRFVLTFPDMIKELIFYLSNNVTPPLILLRNIGAQLLFLALLGYLLWKVLRPLIKRYVGK